MLTYSLFISPSPRKHINNNNENTFITCKMGKSNAPQNETTGNAQPGCGTTICKHFAGLE